MGCEDYKKKIDVSDTIGKIEIFCKLLKANKVKASKEAFVELPPLAQCLFLHHGWEILAKKDTRGGDESYQTAFFLFKLFRGKDMKENKIYKKEAKYGTLEKMYKAALDWFREKGKGKVKGVGRGKKYEKEYQKHPEPESKNDPLFIFYTSLYKEKPNSTLAINWLTENGVFSGEKRVELVRKYVKANPKKEKKEKKEKKSPSKPESKTISKTPSKSAPKTAHVLDSLTPTAQWGDVVEGEKLQVFDGKKLIEYDYYVDDEGQLPSKFKILSSFPKGHRHEGHVVPPTYWAGIGGPIVHFDHKPYREELLKNLKKSKLEDLPVVYSQFKFQGETWYIFFENGSNLEKSIKLFKEQLAENQVDFLPENPQPEHNIKKRIKHGRYFVMANME